MEDLISRSLRVTFRRFVERHCWTIQSIKDAFYTADIQRDVNFSPDVEDEKGRLVEQYFTTLDWKSASDMEKVLTFFSFIINDSGRRLAITSKASDPAQNEYAEELNADLESLKRQIADEGFGILGGKIRAKSDDKIIASSSNNTKLSLFISHVSQHKYIAKMLKDHLALFGVKAFVAHEDIEPTTEWITKIEDNLFSMDALLTLHTAGFSQSPWMNQEIDGAWNEVKGLYAATDVWNYLANQL